jgi:hypothetical protein
MNFQWNFFKTFLLVTFVMWWSVKDANHSKNRWYLSVVNLKQSLLIWCLPSQYNIKCQGEMMILLFSFLCSGGCLGGNIRADSRFCDLFWRSIRWSNRVACYMTSYEFTAMVKDQDLGFENALCAYIWPIQTRRWLFLRQFGSSCC